MIFRSAFVLSKRRIYETFISPGFYFLLSISFFIAYALLQGFLGTIDSSGLNFSLNPLYNFINGILEGAFGSSVVDKIFSEGPYIFILYVSFIPLIIFFSVSSVLKFGVEKSAGAVELYAYGPADGSSYFLASLIKDAFFTLLSLILLTAFLAVSAGVNNLLLGGMFFRSLIILVTICISIYAYGILMSVLIDNPSGALALFLGINIFFALILVGSFSIISEYVQTLSSTLAWILQWISPYFYWNLSLGAFRAGQPALYLAGTIIQVLLAGLVLYLSGLVIRKRGVRS